MKHLSLYRSHIRSSLALAFVLSAFTLTLTLDTLTLDVQSAHARRANVPGEAEIKAGNNQAAIDKLSAIEAKDAAEYYLLGRAYMNLGKRVEAHEAWTHALHINNDLKRGKWKFLFPPNKPLKAKQKSRLKAEFEDEYRALGAAVKRLKTTQARDKVNQAKRTRVDAQKRDAKERQLNKAAAAKGRSIASKQKMADRKSKTRQQLKPKVMRRTKGSGSPWWLIIIGAIFLIIILAAIFGRRSGGGGRRVTRYEVVYDDHPFDRGPFYYQGSYYRSHDHFYGAHGYHYTNRMYRDNYDRWGSGQRYDEALDQEIHHDIDERESLSMAAAEEGYQADVMRADADHYEQDARELHQEIEDGDEAASFFDDGHEFEDDEFSDDEGAGGGEFEDDEFSDDEAHSDYDDGGYDDGGYDDGGYDDGGYDDGGYDDGGYDDGGFEDDPEA